jgi:hypothetical protein
MYGAGREDGEKGEPVPLISVGLAWQRAQAALFRFPGVLVSASIAAGTALALVEHPRDSSSLTRGLLVATLGLPLFTAIAATAEGRRWGARMRWGAALGAAVLLGGVFLLAAGWTTKLRWIHYIQLSLLFHLLVAILPFDGGAAQRGFWQFNRLLFQRFLLATLYTGVLFAALAIALLALDRLLGIDVPERSYARLGVLLAFVFHPWFFLGGLPTDLAALENVDDYPGGLKVFAQFILVPVVSIYLLILSAYLVRVLVTRTWPSGWIGYLVSSVAVVGTLALLLVHPIRQRADSRWVDTYGRWFYVALLPSIVMLLLAIYQRVHQYGTTESRYFLVVLGLWLAGIALFFGVTGSRNIRTIPVTLCLVTLATLLGPWSATAVSRRSQAGRLGRLLVRNDLLSAGQVKVASREVTPEDRREISAAVRYLVGTHGSRALRAVSLDLEKAAAEAVVQPEQRDFAARSVIERLGLSYVQSWESPAANWVSYFSGRPGVVPVEGFEVLVQTDLTTPRTIPVAGDTLSLTFSASPPMLHAARQGHALLDVPLTPLLEQAREAQRNAVSAADPSPARPTTAPGPAGGPAPLTLDAEGGGLRLRLFVTNLNGQLTGENWSLSSADGFVVVGVSPGSR